MNRNLTVASLMLVVLVFSLPAVGIEKGLQRFDQNNQVKKKFWVGRLGDRNNEGESCSDCQEKQSIDRMKYLRRALSSNSNDYQQFVLVELRTDQNFVKQCLSKMVAKDVELFFTITTEGGVDDIVSFPRKVTARCLKKKIKQLNFAAPEQVQHLWLVASSLN